MKQRDNKSECKGEKKKVSLREREKEIVGPKKIEREKEGGRRRRKGAREVKEEKEREKRRIRKKKRERE